jgi:hypothetical protein
MAAGRSRRDRGHALHPDLYGTHDQMGLDWPPAHPPSTRRPIPRSGDRVNGRHHDIHSQEEIDAFPDRKDK